MLHLRLLSYLKRFRSFFLKIHSGVYSFCIRFVTRQLVPGRKVAAGWIDQDMNLLGRHIALCQEKYFLPGIRMNGNIHNNHSMTG